MDSLFELAKELALLQKGGEMRMNYTFDEIKESQKVSGICEKCRKKTIESIVKIVEKIGKE